MTLISLFKCNGNAEPDPTKPPIWCEKLFYTEGKGLVVLAHKTKSDKHLCKDCAKNRVKLPKPIFDWKKGKAHLRKESM